MSNFILEMSNVGSTSQGVYAPLPQSISDSDSEEELHSSVAHSNCINSHKLSIQNNLEKRMVNGKETMNNYHPLDEGDDHNMNGFPGINLSDDIPIIKDGVSSEMSTVRKLFFVISILLCFFTIVIFLWVLPCNEDATCPALNLDNHSFNWEKTYLGIELKSNIEVVSGPFGKHRNLIFLFRGDLLNRERDQNFQKIPPNGGGLISIMSNTGKVAWFISQHQVPSDIDCSIIDVDKDKETDCIVIGEHGLMMAVNPISGTIVWYLHEHNIPNRIFTSVDFPLIIPDLDNDGVNELLTSCAINNSNHNNLIIVSGKYGSVLGYPLTVTECSSIHKISLDKNFLVSYICQNNTFKELDVNLQDLYHKISSKSLDLSKLYIENIRQHRSEIKLNRENQRNVYSVHNHKLVVENVGKCPSNCNVSVQLIDQQSGRDNLTWSHTGSNMYGMVPATLIFNNTPINCAALKGHISGFILKFWQWSEPHQYKNEKLSVNNHSRKMLHYVFDDLTTKQRTWSITGVRNKRNVFNVKNIAKYSNFSIHLLTERVVLITFNSTDIHIVNASQNEITQICTVIDSVHTCQPDLNFQENSVLISDLDRDGSQELISYLSTYVNIDEMQEKAFEHSWQLQSIVKIVRLEAELPKLYEAVSKY